MSREYGPDWYVSWHNFAGSEGEARPPFVIHDSTLREGDQQAGILFTPEEKVDIAQALDRLGVDRLESGMVAVSEEDRRAIRDIVELGLNAEIWTIVRSIPQDVTYAVESGVVGTGVIILANEFYCDVFGWTVEEAIGKALAASEQAKNGGLKTSLLIADSTRMPADRLEQIVTATAGSQLFDALALMDTFGVLNPAGTRHLIESVRALTDLPLEIHPHNDFGLGTANAFAGLEAGASVVHTSMLGLGERLGNTPLEQFAIAAPLLYGYDTGLDLANLREAAELVQRSARIELAPNTPVIGASYLQIESGTVASEFTRMSKTGRDLQWLFPFVPRLIGDREIELVIGKGSGIANIRAALERCGLELSEEEQREVLAAAKSEAVRLHRLLDDHEVAELAKRTSPETQAIG